MKNADVPLWVTAVRVYWRAAAGGSIPVKKRYKSTRRKRRERRGGKLEGGKRGVLYKYCGMAGWTVACTDFLKTL